MDPNWAALMFNCYYHLEIFAQRSYDYFFIQKVVKVIAQINFFTAQPKEKLFMGNGDFWISLFLIPRTILFLRLTKWLQNISDQIFSSLKNRARNKQSSKTTKASSLQALCFFLSLPQNWIKLDFYDAVKLILHNGALKKNLHWRQTLKTVVKKNLRKKAINFFN